MHDVVTAGLDSSATTMQWMLAELINHPEAMHKVRDEINVAVVGNDRIAGEADLMRLSYLQAAFKEMLWRTSEFMVPPETAVFINVWAIGRLVDMDESGDGLMCAQKHLLLLHSTPIARLSLFPAVV
ncbi:hypothetical protein HU200_050593 [Digitaria exilis]|uniref:Cytochrome P450 n=1 Tax=Digitaria exilis TaxID=1010633 RepID=A0A835AMU0_9POAL|nr:hypothetical protein HU200_050593 [Digitaria exilis]